MNEASPYIPALYFKLLAVNVKLFDTILLMKNKGISDPSKMTYVLQKLIKRTG